MPVPQYFIAPWRDTPELLSVRDSLYNPSSAHDHSTGVARIHAWKLRGNLPHAVESTGLLFSAAQLHNSTIDETRSKTRDSSVSEAFAIKATYTLALSRFVTGFADLGRHRAGAGQTMQDVARQIGLPASFVEIRHEATHEDIPTLGRLNKMTTEALGWLWQTYWSLLGDDDEAEPERASDVPAKREALNQIRAKLKAFRSMRVAAIAEKSTRSKASNDMIALTAKTCIGAVRGGDVGCVELAQLLVSERMIIPTKMDLYAAEALAKGAHIIWNDLLLAFADDLPDLMQALLNLAVEEISQLSKDVKTDPRIVLDLWVFKISTSQEWHRRIAKQSLLTWLWTACCLHPGPGTSRLAARLLESEHVDSSIAQTWRPIIEASKPKDDPVDTENESIRLHITETSSTDTAAVTGWDFDTRPWQPSPIGTIAQ